MKHTKSIHDPGYEIDSDYKGYRSGSYYPVNAGTQARKIIAYHEIKYKLEEELIEYVSKRAHECNIKDSAYISRLIKRDMKLCEKILSSASPENSEDDTCDSPEGFDNSQDCEADLRTGISGRVLRGIPEDIVGDVVVTEKGRKYKKSAPFTNKKSLFSAESRNEDAGFM